MLRVMDAAGKLKWVHIFSAGIEKYTDLPKRENDSVAITNIKIYQGSEIADHVFALLPGLTRSMPEFMRAQDESS